MKLLTQLFTLINLCGIGFSQSSYNHPELNWYTFETEHFIFHYHNETERSAREAATVAETVYYPITDLYDFEPDSKTHIILKDTDDYSNGAAFYYDNKIEIWALPLDFDLRGAHRWIQDVITHEFTHIIQIGASMKYSRRFPGAYIQMMGYEDEKRDDVLYGYPNTIISYPIPGTAVPPWLAEGTAQYMYPGANFDYLDSHRDMILRDRVFHNNVLSFDEMNTFGKTGIGNESTYNQGFSMVYYLAEKYGVDVLKTISQNLSNPFSYSINKAIKNATGKSGYDNYSDWISYLQENYSEFFESIKKNEVKGHVLESEGTTNIHPVWAPDGERFAFLSNKENDYFGQTNVYIYSLLDSTSEMVASGVKTAVTWTDDSTIVYSKRSKPNSRGSKYFDLYSYDFTSEEEERLTFDARLFSPAYNSETKQIVAITSYDGTSNIMISSTDSINFVPLTQENDGIQMFSLSWINNNVYVDATDHHERQLYMVDLTSGEIIRKTNLNWDSRDVEFSQDGLVYSSDKSGVYNLWVESESNSGYITNVQGGAFMPSVSKNGDILYSVYDNAGFNIALIRQNEITPIQSVGFEDDYFTHKPESELIDTQYIAKSYKYEDEMSKLFFLPRVMMDYNTIKPGFYTFANDVLDRLMLFGGASTNKDKDLDLFLILEYKKFFLTLYSNLFWRTRHTESDYFYTNINGLEVPNIPIHADVAFQLFSSDIGTRFQYKGHKFWLNYSYSNYREHITQIIKQSIDYNNEITNNTFLGEIAFDYYRGHSFSIDYKFDKRKPQYVKNMLPSNGYEIDAKYSYELNNFMDGFAISEEYSTFGANFVPNNTHRLEVDVSKHFTLDQSKRITATLSSHLGVISNTEIDDFFYFCGGGRPGIKGYSFYEESLTGPGLLIGSGYIRYPLLLEGNIPLAQFSLQNISLGGLFQTGSVFRNNLDEIIDNRKASFGVEFRVSGYSFFAYPTAISYELHHAINDGDEPLKQYFSILFDF